MSNSPQPAGRLTRHHLLPHRRLRRISAAEQSTTVNEQRTILVFEEAQRADSNDCHGFQSVEKGQQNNQSPERVTENNFAVGVYRSQLTRLPAQGTDGSLAQTSPRGHSSTPSLRPPNHVSGARFTAAFPANTARTESNGPSTRFNRLGIRAANRAPA